MSVSLAFGCGIGFEFWRAPAEHRESPGNGHPARFRWRYRYGRGVRLRPLTRCGFMGRIHEGFVP